MHYHNNEYNSINCPAPQVIDVHQLTQKPHSDNAVNSLNSWSALLACSPLPLHAPRFGA